MMDKSDRITGKGKDHKRGRKKIDGMVGFAMNFGDYLDLISSTKKKPYQESGIRYL